MKAQRYPQYTRNWTNILGEWYTPFSGEALDWLREYDGKGMYHLHRSGSAVKFENEEDAAMFVLKFT